jgi:glycosyltransferase involved in cell wall biosynthesis
MVFGSIGRFAPEKGMDVLIRAFSRAFPRGEEDVRLVIIGDGPQADELCRLGGGDARIMVRPPQSEIARFYRAFDVYVSAARFEPFGLTILEAMDADCPLIVTRTDGPKEFVKEPSVEWSDPDDHDSLAAALSMLATRRRARIDYDMSLFRVERAASAIESFYRRLAQTGARRSLSAGG